MNILTQALFVGLISGLLSPNISAAERGAMQNTINDPKQKDPRCSMPHESGPCKALLWMYYYDGTTNSCKEFAYGGCEGSVPFETQDECNAACVETKYEEFPVKKPALYLYPKQPTNIKILLNIKGELTSSIPPYGKGWSVLAQPNGKIDSKYDYLFYEADLAEIALPNEGWNTTHQELEKWFDIHLPILGLNTKETVEFKEYWLKALPNAPYYVIRLLDRSFLDSHLDVQIDPKPDTFIRVELVFSPQNEAIILNAPRIRTPIRKGFTAVEWGGVIVNK